MLTLAERIAAAAPGAQLEIGVDEAPILEAVLIDKALSLLGATNAVLRGSARDALIRVTSAGVTIAGVGFERTPRPDGSTSWGSLIVVEGPGEATLRGCRFSGAADGWAIEPAAKLQPGEAWLHAGVDVRSTGHARLEDCRFDACSTAISVSIYPADKEVNLVARRVQIAGGTLGVKVIANARAELRELTVGDGTDTALKADNSAEVTGEAVEVRGARVGIWVDEKASVKLKKVDIDAETAGIVVRANASASLIGGRIARAYCAAEVHGLGGLRLSDLEIAGVKLGVWACDAASAEVDTLRFTGDAPEWGAYADCAAIVAADAPLPGERSSAGVAQVPGGTCSPWDVATWIRTLRDRTAGYSAPVRAGLALAYQRQLRNMPGPLTEAELSSLIEPIFRWGELGAAGLAEPLAVVLRPVHRFKIPAEVSAMVADGERLFVSHTDRRLRAWSEAGVELWEAKCPPAATLIAANGLLVAVPPDHGSDALLAFDPATGRAIGMMCPRASLAAMALGPTIEMSTYDSTGHPTDRSSYRERWTLPDARAPSECLEQGAVLLPPPAGSARWDWVSPDMGGPGRVRTGFVRAPGGGERPGSAVVAVEGLTLVAQADALRAFDAGGALVAVFRESAVSHLAMGHRLWLATAGPELSVREISFAQ